MTDGKENGMDKDDQRPLQRVSIEELHKAYQPTSQTQTTNRNSTMTPVSSDNANTPQSSTNQPAPGSSEKPKKS
jgi:hypothetical protein